MSNARAGPSRKRKASPCSTSAPRAPHSESLARSSRAAAPSRSTKVTCAAPLDRDSRPSAPLPANRSRQRAPDTRGPSQLKSVSRTRSGVGRISGSGGKRSFLPRQVPPMILSTRASRAPREFARAPARADEPRSRAGSPPRPCALRASPRDALSRVLRDAWSPLSPASASRDAPPRRRRDFPM